MPLKRIKETFRLRMPEWILAVCMLIWGLITLGSPHLFSTEPFFTSMLVVMPQFWWGTIVLSIGLIRLMFLIINGTWRPSAHIRAVGCALGVMFWSVRLIATISLSWLTPIAACYCALIGLDLISLWFASGDAKLADLSARSRLK